MLSDVAQDSIIIDARHNGPPGTGNGGWSASVSLLVFSLSYSSSSGHVLQKAATYDYYAS